MNKCLVTGKRGHEEHLISPAVYWDRACVNQAGTEVCVYSRYIHCSKK